MTDPRVTRMARLLTEYSANIQSGDRVLIEAETAAEPLVRELYKSILQAGGHPYLLASFAGQTSGYSGVDDVFFEYASTEQLKAPIPFLELAYREFESRIRIHSSSNTQMLSQVDPKAIQVRSAVPAEIIKLQFDRGARGDFKWVTTQFPTAAYAQDAEMSLEEYEDYLFLACRVDESVEDPVAEWEQVRREQDRLVDLMATGHDIHIRSPNCDLSLSIDGRKFINAYGNNNMPDGEIFTGPVEDSVEGWVEYTFPAVYRGRLATGVRLEFQGGQVVKATAERGQEFLNSQLNVDPGARYVGEFAIGLNEAIQRHTRNILFDEKIGGSFHMALGRGYPETGSKNESAIHWDMICDLHDESEIKMDGAVIYRDGKFIV